MIVKRNFEKEKVEAQMHVTQKAKNREKDGGLKAGGNSSEEDDSEDDEILTDEKIIQIKELDNHYLN